MASPNDPKGTTQGPGATHVPDSQPMGMNSSQSIANNVPPKIDEVMEPA